MASIRARADNNLLFFDFRYRGVRCREQTALTDTKANRARMEKVLKMIEAEIQSDTFNYRQHFPSSKMAAKFDLMPVGEIIHSPAQNTTQNQTPLLKVFVEQWYSQFSVSWRRSYKKTVRQIVDSRLIPAFGDRPVGSIRREDILTFRADLAKNPGRVKDTLISGRRINGIVLVLKQVLNEAAEQFHFTTPTSRIKQLKVPKTDVQPFTLDEVQLIINNVRPDFRNYYIVRFFTGMRTGEIDGLKWKYIDFEGRC